MLSTFVKNSFGDDCDFVEVAEQLNADYEWDSVEVYYSPSKRHFFWFYDGGNSMECASEFSDASDFLNGSKDEMLRDLKNSNYMEAWEQARQFHPNA